MKCGVVSFHFERRVRNGALGRQYSYTHIRKTAQQKNSGSDRSGQSS